MVASLLWFRKGLRLHDSPALAAAVEGSTRLYPVFVIDPWFVSSGSVGANRLHFLLQSLQDLDTRLRALDSRLIVLRGNPTTELPRVMREWKIDRIAFEIDTEPYAKKRDAEISACAAEAGVEVTTRWGHTLCDLDALLARHPKGEPTTTYASFLKHLDKQIKAEPLTIIDAPSSLPPLGDLANDASAQTGVPTPDELGLPAASPSVILPGGETEALARMDAHIARTQWIAKFEKPMVTTPRVSNPNPN